MKYDPVDIARQYLFVREAGQNEGQRVNAVQIWSGGKDGLGLSWCCYFATMVLDICAQGESPIPRTGVCQEVYDLAKQNGWVTDSPNEGDLFLYVNDQDHAHHVGFYTGGGNGIAGNTDASGTSSNGDGVHEHAISAKVFVAYPR